MAWLLEGSLECCSSSSPRPTRSRATLPAKAYDTILRGGVHVEPDWLPSELTHRMRADAETLQRDGLFVADGLTNTAKLPRPSRASARWRIGRPSEAARDGAPRAATRVRAPSSRRAWTACAWSSRARSTGRRSPSRASLAHEITYNWYAPNARLGRHLDEHHEETKGPRGWTVPHRRSVTWLVYLNDGWAAAEGGELRTFPRAEPATAGVGAHDGNLQIGWLGEAAEMPVFLDAARPDAKVAMYVLGEGKARQYVSRDFMVPPKPIDFGAFLVSRDLAPFFEQISTERLDPRFATASTAPLPAAFGAPSKGEAVLEVLPRAGTLVLFDSVSLPHQVQPVTGKRNRVAATGWFHEDSVFPDA